MGAESDEIKALREELARLKAENAHLRESQPHTNGPTVNVPDPLKPIFDAAQQTVGDYFKDFKWSPDEGTIEINSQRYVLVRASALSHEFFHTIKNLFADQGDEEAINIGRNILFDVAHVIGMEDAKNFHERMNLKDPIEKLSAGPIHFAYTGWAFVDVLPESTPAPDENYYLRYHHPYSFEAESWISAGIHSETPVCIMNAGYSSGWCESSFGVSLTAVEVSCRACGDDHCTFVMAPPEQIEKYLEQEKQRPNGAGHYQVPSFFERQEVEQKIKDSLVEKEVLLKEIHHRVKNNLQIISSLLNLQSSGIEDKEAREKFNESINRVQSMALIHETLYGSKDLSKLDIKAYLTSLLSSLQNTYSLNLEQIEVNVELEVEMPDFAIETAIPCGLIINELVSNSFKHAFNGLKSGHVKVSFTQVKKESDQPVYRIEVKDNGVGISEESLNTESGSLGLQLVQTLVEQLDGTMELSRDNGSLFVIEFAT